MWQLALTVVCNGILGECLNLLIKTPIIPNLEFVQSSIELVDTEKKYDKENWKRREEKEKWVWETKFGCIRLLHVQNQRIYENAVNRGCECTKHLEPSK